MFKEYYQSIKQLLSQIDGLKYIEYYLGQYDQIGDNHVLDTPIAYVELLPTNWSTGQSNLQEGLLSFRIHLVTETAYGDERDITSTNHLDLVAKIYKALQGEGAMFEDEQENSYTLMNKIERRNSTPHSTINNLIVTTEEYCSYVFDWSAMPKTRTLNVNIVTNTTIAANA